MNIRPKTVRRLLVVVAAAVVVVAAVLGVRSYKSGQRAVRLQADRDAGIAAWRQGDYASALEKLKTYVRKDTRDFDALLAYASSRARLELPNGRHIPEAIQSFEVLRSLRPVDRDVQRALLDLYTQAGLGTEAITLADAVLAAQPNDVDALRAKTIALWRSGRFDEALQASLKWNDAAPLQLAGHTQTYLLLIKTKAPKDQILARYRDLLARHPDDPRFEMLLGVATGDAGDRDTALRMLRSAAARPPPDAEFVAQLARIFDQQRLFDESQRILEQAARQSDDPAILRVLVRRLWQNGDYEQVLARLASLDAASASADGSLLAFRALALLSLNRIEDGQAAVTQLKARVTDPVAQGWAAALQTRLDSPSLSPTQVIARYQTALSRGAAGAASDGTVAPSGENGIIRYWMGEAHLALGEIDAAIRQWQIAADLMPSWAAPHVRVARALLDRDRPMEALESAAAAVRCAPNQVAPLTTLALARYALLQQNPVPADEERLAQLVAEIQRIKPGEPQTLSLHAALLCRAGQSEAARAAIRSALPSADGAWDAEVFANLVAVSREYDLGLEAELVAATGKAAQRSPQMALRHALDAARHGAATSGREALEAAVQRAAPGAEALAWQVALAQFREAVDDPAAAATWQALGDANPEDFTVQSLILQSAGSIRGNEEFWARTVDRVRKLTGDDGTLWRVARARLLLQTADRAGVIHANDPAAAASARQRDSAEAVGLLTELVRTAPTVAEYRVLLAHAMENLGNDKEAAQQLQAAVESDPRSVSVQIELARLLTELGRSGEARKHLERAADGGAAIQPGQRLPLARMLASAGRLERAADVLEAGPSPRSLAGDLLLANVYRKLGRESDAAPIYQRLLSEAPTKGNADVIAEAADFQAWRGDLPAARRTLALLDGLSLPDARLHTLLGQFEERWGGTGDATSHLRAAAEAAPTDPLVWRNLAMLHARLGQFDSAVAVIDRGLEQAPSGDLRLARVQVEAMRKVSTDPTDLSPLIDALSVDEGRSTDAGALSALRDTLATTRPSAGQISRLRQSAERYSQFLPLQAALAQAYLQSGQADDAATVAFRLLESSRGDARAAALATTIFRSARQWPGMLSAAQAWRAATRSSDAERTRPADIAIADAALRLNRPTVALAAVQPHLSGAAGSPVDGATVAELAGAALCALGRFDDVRALFEPLLGSSSEYRLAFLRLIGESTIDAGTAAAWIELARARLDASSPVEALAFARAGVAAGTRLAAPQLFDPAMTALAPLLSGVEPNLEAAYIAAAVHLRQDRLPEAQRLLRIVVTRDPSHAAAANDLAWAMLATRGDLNEARSLASRAITAQPNVATYQETLARVELELGNREAAIAGFDAALRLEPSNVDALIGKAYVLRRNGDTAAARRLLAQVDPLLARNPPLSAMVKGQLQQLRDELSRGD